MQKKVSKYNDNMLNVYFKQIKKFPLLTFEEELLLSRKIQEEDNDALHKLVNSNLRLVIKIAGLYNASDIPMMDLIQEGNIGLMHAAKKYDYRKKVRFCTYASWWIKQFISRYISNKRRLVRLPERKEEILRKVQRAYNVLCQTLMYQPRVDDVAKELGISVHDVNSLVNMTMDVNNNDETGSVVDIQEDYTYSPEQNLMKKVSREGTLRVLNKLKDKEKYVLSYRYQLDGCERHTLREIGDMLNMSPETVRQTERRALKKIRSHANELRECLYVEAI